MANYTYVHVKYAKRAGQDAFKVRPETVRFFFLHNVNRKFVHLLEEHCHSTLRTNEEQRIPKKRMTNVILRIPFVETGKLQKKGEGDFD